MEERDGVQHSNTAISQPELDAEHNESMGAGHLRLYLSDPVDDMPYDVRLCGAAACDGSQHKAAAQSYSEEAVQGPGVHRRLHGAERQPEQPQSCANLAVTQPGHQVRGLHLVMCVPL